MNARLLGRRAARVLSRPRAWVGRARRRSSSNFRFAFSFLAPPQRQALSGVYAFCRVIDDIVDEPDISRESAIQALDHWRDQIEALFDGSFARPSSRVIEPLTRDLAASYTRFAFPKEAFLGIIDGCQMDLDQSTYQSVEELDTYCYRVASCVGLLCIAIFGEQSPAAQAFAKELGLALQYTNILRDVAEDAQRGRVYLPEELLARHGLSQADILRHCYDTRFVQFARQFADLAQHHYDQAQRELAKVKHPGRLFAANVMGQTYHQILKELRSINYDVFTRRPKLRRRDKLQAALSAGLVDTLPLMLRGALRSS